MLVVRGGWEEKHVKEPQTIFSPTVGRFGQCPTPPLLPSRRDSGRRGRRGGSGACSSFGLCRGYSSTRLCSSSLNHDPFQGIQQQHCCNPQRHLLIKHIPRIHKAPQHDQKALPQQGGVGRGLDAPTSTSRVWGLTKAWVSWMTTW